MVDEQQETEEMEEVEDAREEQAEDDMEYNKELLEAYGYPTPDPKYNQHVFLHKAAFESADTVRTTFLSKEELGRPLFSVRFMLDLKILADHMLANPFSNPNPQNKISQYFLDKVQNVTSSGMSNEGFAMNLNVTQKRDMIRKKIRDISGLKNQKGGQKRNVT